MAFFSRWKYDRDFKLIISPLLATTEIQDLRLYTQHHHTDRLTHSICVAYIAYNWARQMGLDYESTARGGIMHDMYYYQTGEVAFSEGNHLNNHPKIALLNAKQIADLNDLEEDIIIKHMFGYTPERPSYRESYMISAADKVSATREFFLKNALKFDNVLDFFEREMLEISNDDISKKIITLDKMADKIEQPSIITLD